jgi:hypothetical protein
MKPQHITFVVAEPWHTTDWTTDLGLLVRSLQQQGYESSLTCTQIVGKPTDYPTSEATLEQMSDPAYWQARGVTIAVVFNWLVRGSAVLQALRRAGVFVLQFGDSDGLEGMRVHPQVQITRMWHLRPTMADKWEGMFTLLKKYLYSHRKEDSLLLTNLETAHITTLTSTTGREAFLRFVRWAGRGDLVERVQVLPSPITPSFLQREVVAVRKPSIVAVGRWKDPQKDAPLLVATLRHYLPTASPETTVTLIGAGGEPHFADLTRDFPQVRYIGRIPHAEMADHLGKAQILLFSSRWEGVPVVSLEMVALGGTVVGPAALPGLAQYSADDAGTTAPQRTPAALSQALQTESHLWATGQRNPEVIATRWRHFLDPDTIARQIMTWATKNVKTE